MFNVDYRERLAVLGDTLLQLIVRRIIYSQSVICKTISGCFAIKSHELFNFLEFSKSALLAVAYGKGATSAVSILKLFKWKILPKVPQYFTSS